MKLEVSKKDYYPETHQKLLLAGLVHQEAVLSSLEWEQIC